MCDLIEDHWPGKDVIFMLAGWALKGTRGPKPKKLNQANLRQLKEVSDILAAAIGWAQFCYGKVTAADLPEKGFEAYKLLRHAVGDTDLSQATSALNTINAMLVGQKPNAASVAQAARLCHQVGEYLRHSHMRDPLSGCTDPDNDDD